MENSGAVHMLQLMKTEDLGSMYKLLGRVKGGHDKLIDCICKHLKWLGTELVTDAQLDLEPVNYVQVILTNPQMYRLTINGLIFKYLQKLFDLRDRYDTFFVESFEQDPMFDKKLCKEFNDFINLNIKSSEYLR